MTAGTASLEMDLNLRYTNRSNQKIILYKGHDLFYQTRVRSAGRVTLEPYEVLHLNMRYFDEEFEAIDRSSPGAVFVTLPPNHVFERRMTIGIGLVGENGIRGKDAIREGEHTLQLIISSWYKTRPLAEQLRERWKAKGILWIDPLFSKPVQFVALRPQTLQPCK